MNVRKRKIESMTIDEISHVNLGDDPKATVVISKAYMNAVGEPPASTMHSNNTAATTSEEPMPETNESVEDFEIDYDSLDPNVRAYIEALEDVVTDSIDTDDEDDDEDDATTKPELELVDKSAEELLKSHPEIAAIIKSAEERAERAETIAKEERDARIYREMVTKAQSLPMIDGNVEQKAAVLSRLHELDPDVADVVEDMLAKANKTIAQSNMFGEVGKSSPGLSDPVEARVAELRKAHPELSYEAAVTKAYTDNPSLYTKES